MKTWRGVGGGGERGQNKTENGERKENRNPQQACWCTTYSSKLF